MQRLFNSSIYLICAGTFLRWYWHLYFGMIMAIIGLILGACVVAVYVYEALMQWSETSKQDR